MEQEEYTKEKIDWSYIEFVDNQDVLDLLEKVRFVIFSYQILFIYFNFCFLVVTKYLLLIFYQSSKNTIIKKLSLSYFLN